MSSNLTVRQDFSPSCPSGGTWWACGYGTYFVGCCARDPCDITCAAGNLYPGAFDPTKYGEFPDATCGTGSKFYTCTAGKTFWGCCKTNPCAQGGCPDGDLENAILNRPDLLSAYHATGGSTTISSATATSTGDPTVTAASVSSSAASSQSDSKTPVAAIAGGAAGGAFAIAAIVGILLYFCCFKKRRGRISRTQTMPLVSGMTENDQQTPHIKPIDAPPDYTSPNPNFSTSTHAFYNPHSHPPVHPPHDPHYMTYAYNANAHNTPYDLPHPHQPPQELALTSPATVPSTPHQFRSHKSMYGHVRGPSELSGEHALSELSSGPQSPDMRGGGVWKGGMSTGGGGGEKATKSGFDISARGTAGVSPLIETRDRSSHQDPRWEEVTPANEEIAIIAAAPRHHTSSPPPPRHTITSPPPRQSTPYRSPDPPSRSHSPSPSVSPSPSLSPTRSSPHQPVLPRRGGGEEEFRAVRNWMAPRDWDSAPQQRARTDMPQQRRIRRKKRMEGVGGGNESGGSSSESSGEVQGLGVLGVESLGGERGRRGGDGDGDGDGSGEIARGVRDVRGGYGGAI